MRLRHPLLLAALAVAAVTTLAAVMHHFRVERRWARMEHVAAALEAVLDARDQRRPVLLGPSESGNAWDAYLPAIASIPADTDAQVRAVVADRRQGTPWRSARDTLLAAHGAALDGLARGAHRDEARYPIRWREGYNQRGLHSLKVRALGTLALFRAERHLERGAGESAVEAFLDAVQFACDLLETPESCSELVLQDVTNRHDPRHPDFLAQLLDLPRAELARIEEGLRTLDESLKLSAPQLEIEIVRGVRHAQGPLGTDAFCRGLAIPDMLRFGFSERFVVADHFLNLARHAAIVRPLADGSWTSHYAATQRHEVEVRRTGNPLTRDYARIPTFQTRRQSIARLRMLRMAVEYRLRGRATPLPDPFGTTLGHEIVDGKLRLWSLGMQHRATRYDVLEVPMGTATPVVPAAPR